MALGSNQLLTEMSTRIISWGKGGRCVMLKTYHHPVPLSRNVGTLNSWNPLDPSEPITGLIYILPLDERSARSRVLYLTHDTYKRHAWHRRDSNPQSQQASDRRPRPQTARLRGLALVAIAYTEHINALRAKCRGFSANLTAHIQTNGFWRL